MRAAICSVLVTSMVAVENPTGLCTANGNRTRLGYPFPGEVATYIPDCRSPLKREYWRIFYRESAGTAYMIPRPDGLGLKYNLCGKADLDALFQKYSLCVESSSDLAVNSLQLEDAINISRAMHKSLVLEAGEELHICPFALQDDVFACCDRGLAAEEAAQSHCEELRGLCDDNGLCLAVAVTPSQEAVGELVPASNELYGISAAIGAGTASGATPVLYAMACLALVSVP